MSYRVLARAYRSNTFDEVVGLEAVATTLKNAIASGRIHHGYVFTGTRGVGKTSMARILAKSLNCLSSDGPTAQPCCACDSCRNVAIGEDVDVVEIDAASNNGVDHIRDLRSNAGFRPARSRFKVYIVDEVHMLSKAAFNALLKTLEEPPEHVKFIMATTEPEKVPATIKSRCQNFDFRAISAEKISGHLSDVLKQEGVEAEAYVVKRVARLANGSMRDGLSLLDQLLSYESRNLTAEIADLVIPPSHDEQAAAIMEAVASSDAAQALLALDAALQSGRTVEKLCDHLIEHVRSLMLLRLCGPETELVDVPSQLRESLHERSQSFDPPTYVFMISLLEELRRNARSESGGRALADAAVVRLAMSAQFSNLGALIERIESGLPEDAGSGRSATLPSPEKKKFLTRDVEARNTEARSEEGQAREAGPDVAGSDRDSVTALSHAQSHAQAQAQAHAQSHGPAHRPATDVLASAEQSAAAKPTAENSPDGNGRPTPVDATSAEPNDEPERRFHTDYGEGDMEPPSDFIADAHGGTGTAAASVHAADGNHATGGKHDQSEVTAGYDEPLTSEAWQKAGRDPLVIKVRDAVDGTLFDIRPARRGEPPQSSSD